MKANQHSQKLIVKMPFQDPSLHKYVSAVPPGFIVMNFVKHAPVSFIGVSCGDSNAVTNTESEAIHPKESVPVTYL